MHIRLKSWVLLACLALLGLAGCGEPTSDNTVANLDSEPSGGAPLTPFADLEAIKQRGQLRILVGRLEEAYLPRQGLPIHRELDLASAFAESLNLKPIFIYRDHFAEMIPQLLAGEGDLIAANMTVTESRKRQVAFTVPVSHSKEQLIIRSTDQGLNSLADLAGRTLAVPAATSFWETAQDIISQHPKINVLTIDSDITTDKVMEQISCGVIDATIEDDTVMSVVSSYRDDVKATLDLGPERPQAWAVHPDNNSLLEALNGFLTQTQLARRAEEISVADLPAMKKRKTLRVLTRNNAVNYFLWRGELMGFEYEWAKRFAKQQKLALEIIVAPDHEALFTMLVEGKGDIAAAFLTPTKQRRKLGVEFSEPYHYAAEKLVGRADEDGFALFSLEDLAGRTIYQRRSSSYWQTLQALQQQGFKFNLEAVPEDMETEDIIAKVASGEYDLTVANSHIINVEQTWRNDIKPLFTIRSATPQAWAIRADNPELLAAVNQFHKEEYRGLHYNILYKKYFKNSKRILAYQEQRDKNKTQGQAISPYDELVKTYAEEYGFDWRLLVAQMYEESRFDPKAESWAGAKGLMQLMPETAQHFGIDDPETLYHPEVSIKTGVEYIHWVHKRLDDEELAVAERFWFALAAYNAGLGHVYDARRLAFQQGLNPNRWFDNVEKAMLLLSKPSYARRARHGYVRGREPVNYVRQIRERYHAYIRLGEPEEKAEKTASWKNAIDSRS